MDANAISELLSVWGYPLFLGLLLLTGVGSPIPEDLLLLSAGYLISVGTFQWPAALTLSLLGVVSSDVAIFSAGRHLARRSYGADPQWLSARRFLRASRWFNRLGPSTIFIARLMPGTRALMFAAAGFRGLPSNQFLKYDLLGAIVWIPMALSIGFIWGERIGGMTALFDSVRRSANWVLGFLLFLLSVWLVWGREQSKL